MVKKTANPVSMCQTQVQIIGDKVYKKYQLIILPQKAKSEVSKLILLYYQQLQNAGIPVPELKSANHNLEFEFAYCGTGMMELAEQDPNQFIESNPALTDQMVAICKTAIKNNVSLDPHFRNFTVDEHQKVWYVDIFPPLLEDYIRLFENPSVQAKVQEHFDLFKPQAIAQHFLADWLKVFGVKQSLEPLANQMKQQGLIQSIDWEFIQSIIKIENANHAAPDFWLM